MRADMQKEIRASVRSHAGALKALALDMHRRPELGMEEIQSVAWQLALLREHGFRVQSPVAGLPTAFKAAFGRGNPVLAVLSEYDALPGLGHGCGHNLIAAAAVGTGLVLAERIRAKRIRGTVVVMGTPGEESKGGKVLMLKKGAFAGIGCAIMGHPHWRSTCDAGSTAIRRFRVEFRGRAAHAAVAPELGRNALDAVMLVFQGVNAWRQQLPETARVHGVVEKGGVLPNIIPQFASCRFFLRSTDDRTLDGMVRRFHDIVRGAALMTGTRSRIMQDSVPYKSRWPNAPLNAAFMEAAGRAGLQPAGPDQTSRGSTDFGDVSQAMPGGHFFFSIAGHEIPFHSAAFEQAAGSAHGLKQMLAMVETLATIGGRYLSDARLRADVDGEFRRRTCTSG